MLQVLGIKDIDYTNKDGRAVRGRNIYVVDLEETYQVVGHVTDSIYVGARYSGWDVALSLKVNDCFDLSYDKDGHIKSIKISKKGE